MKIKKVFGVIAVLLALTVVGCNKTPDNGGSASQNSSAQPSISITAAGNKTSIEINTTLQLTSSVEGVAWESANTGVATIDQAGLVTAVAPGSTTIKATKEGYRNGSFSLTVTKPAAPHPAAPTWPAECPALIDTSEWTAGTAATNAFGKNYIPLTGADGSVGVKIALTDADTGASGSFESDGKIGPQNEASAYVKFSLKAPKAGVYQMILKASVSSSGDEHPFAGESSRGFDVKINDYEDQANVYGSRLYSDAGLDHDEKRAFIFALVQLNGPDFEDEIAFRNPYYRMKFDMTSDLIFAENK